MAAHPNAVPYSGYSCIVCAAKFSSDENVSGRTKLIAHWNAFGHAPASMQSYRIAIARQSLTGEQVPQELVPVEDRVG